MNIETFRNCVQIIEKNLGKTFAKDGINRVWQEVKVQPDKAMFNAGDYVLLNFTSLPAPAKLMEAIRIEGQKIKLAEAKANESEWEAKKEKRGEGASLNKSVGNSEVARLSIMAISGLSSGKMSPEEYVEFHRHMGQKYGDEWFLAGAEIEKDFIRRGIIRPCEEGTHLAA